LRKRSLATAVAALLVAAAPGLAADPPAGAHVGAAISVGDAGGEIAVGFGSVWIVNHAGTVVRVDPTTNAVVDAIAVGRSPFAIATGNGSVWVSNAADDTISRIDPLTDTVVATIAVGLLPIGIAATPGAVWVANHHGDPATSVSRIDPATNTVAATITSPSWPQYFGGPSHVAAGAGSVWVDVNEAHAVARIDPATNVITAMIPVKGVAGGIAASDTGVWVSGGFDAPGVTRIDPVANALVDDKINGGGFTAGIALGFRSVWFATPNTNFLDRADLVTDAITGQLRLAGAFPTSVATGFDSVWVADPAEGLLLRIQPD